MLRNLISLPKLCVPIKLEYIFTTHGSTSTLLQYLIVFALNPPAPYSIPLNYIFTTSAPYMVTSTFSLEFFSP